jgi:hypothetical protein
LFDAIILFTLVFRVRDLEKILKKIGGSDGFFRRCRRRILDFFAHKTRAYREKKTFARINRLPFLMRPIFFAADRAVKKRHNQHLQRLRMEVKHRKIRVVFFLNGGTKWHGQPLCDLFANDSNFEPLIAVAENGDGKSLETIKRDFPFENSNVRIEPIYVPLSNGKKRNCNRETKGPTELRDFRPDVIFFGQPWGIDSKNSAYAVANFALTCYAPYCFHLMVSEYDYLEKFHRQLWRYFVETPRHLENYKARFKADNCLSVGSLHLDRYLVKKEPSLDFWKDKSSDKKRVIYAPHFTFSSSHMMATFHENGQFILNLASMYPETTWLFKPHPNFREHVLSNGVMTKQELDDYLAEWKKYGTVFEHGDFFDAFKTSNCIITDCISFLADYFPTGKPAFHLRSGKQRTAFNDLGKEIVGTYYQIHSNAELEKLFFRAIISGDDFMKDVRLSQVKNFEAQVGGSASQRIFDHIRAELQIK